MNKIAMLLIVLLSIVGHAGPMVDVNSQSELENFLTTGGFNGVVRVAKANQILLKKPFGYKNHDTQIPLKSDDIFQIGSVTKQFVAAALLKLQQEGKLSLEDEIIKYLPHYVKQYKGITVRDILNHTSGITNYTDRPEFWTAFQPGVNLSLSDISEFASRFELDFAPKSKWKYSNTGYIIAGQILEAVSGQSWDSYILNNFLKPFEMNQSGYSLGFSDVSDVKAHVMSEGKLVVFDGMNLSWALSAGALYSTVDDLSKWTGIYEKNSILSDDSLKQMQTPFLDQYALGITVTANKADPSDLMIRHGGRTPGFNTDLIYFKKSKLQVIVVSNVENDLPRPGLELAEFFQTGRTSFIKVNLFPMSETELKSYEGLYAAEKLSVKVFLKEGQLYLHPQDGKQPPFPLKPVDKDSFNLLGFAAEEFLRNQAGVVNALKHYQDGNITIFERQKQ